MLKQLFADRELPGKHHQQEGDDGWAGANMITDKMGNTMIDPASVTDSVLTMVWSLFSLFPAVIAFLLMVLAWKFPIRK
jgi:GPH family glycoside/pentoside/hexuronide:cation symporter